MGSRTLLRAHVEGYFLTLRILVIATRQERKSQTVEGSGTGSEFIVIVVSSRKGTMEGQSTASLLKNIIS